MKTSLDGASTRSMFFAFGAPTLCISTSSWYS